MPEKKIQASRFQQDVLTFLKMVARYGGAHLTCNQLIILGEVWMAYALERSICAVDVRELCDMPKATASRVIASLGAEGLGFIATEPDPQDQRRKLLKPTQVLLQLNDKMSREYRAYWEATR